MAVHHTREEKIRIQQRREQEKFEWKENPASPTEKKTVPTKAALSTDPRLAQETAWLRKDLLQTFIALLLVIILLSYFFWRSL